MTTKQELIAAAAAFAAVPLPIERDIKAQANKAFADNHTGSKLLGTAEQRITFAIMCEVARMVRDEGFNHALADSLTVTDTKTTITARMLECFVSPIAGYEDMSDAAKADAVEEHAKRVDMVKRGVFIGSILESRGITFAYFNVTTGQFSVWATMLTPADVTPRGRLLTDALIPLDDRSLLWDIKKKDGGDGTGKGTACMKLCLSICKPVSVPRKPRTAVGSGATFNAGKITDVAGNVKLSVLIGALHLLLVEDAPAEPMRLCDAPTAWPLMPAIIDAYTKAVASPTWELSRETDAPKPTVAERLNATPTMNAPAPTVPTEKPETAKARKARNAKAAEEMNKAIAA